MREFMQTRRGAAQRRKTCRRRDSGRKNAAERMQAYSLLYTPTLQLSTHLQCAPRKCIMCIELFLEEKV